MQAGIKFQIILATFLCFSNLSVYIFIHFVRGRKIKLNKSSLFVSLFKTDKASKREKCACFKEKDRRERSDMNTPI